MNVMPHLPPPEGCGDKGGSPSNSPSPGLGEIVPGMPVKEYKYLEMKYT